MTSYFSKYKSRKTSNSMSDKVFLEYMQEKQQLQNLLSHLSDMDKVVHTILEKRDDSRNVKIMAVLDLLYLKKTT